MLTDHKFKVDQTVSVKQRDRHGLKQPKYGLAPRGNFQIVRPLPSEQGHNQYRIKSSLDGHERVVKEYEIA